MSETRTLVVTVGKSLFSSASWRREKPFDFRDYGKWFDEVDDKDKSFLSSPERRAKDDETCRKIHKILTSHDPTELSRLVAIGSSEDARRYCAELTTLLVMYRAPGHFAESFREFLNRYEAVALVCPADEEDQAHLAARHLEQILLAHGASNPSGSLLKAVLRAKTSRHRVQQWGEYLDTLAERNNIDLVVTGGYKGFALLAGDIWARAGSERGWRVIYLHQDNNEDLFVHENGAVLAKAPGTPTETLRPASPPLPPRR